MKKVEALPNVFMRSVILILMLKSDKDITKRKLLVNHSHEDDQRLAIFFFFAKGQIVNMLSFVGHTVSDATTELCRCVEAAVGSSLVA